HAGLLPIRQPGQRTTIVPRASREGLSQLLAEFFFCLPLDGRVLQLMHYIVELAFLVNHLERLRSRESVKDKAGISYGDVPLLRLLNNDPRRLDLAAYIKLESQPERLPLRSGDNSRKDLLSEGFVAVSIVASKKNVQPGVSF